MMEGDGRCNRFMEVTLPDTERERKAFPGRRMKGTAKMGLRALEAGGMVGT